MTVLAAVRSVLDDLGYGVPVRPWVAWIVKDELARQFGFAHELKFDPGQPRDSEGRWTDGGPGGGISALTGGEALQRADRFVDTGPPVEILQPPTGGPTKTGLTVLSAAREALAELGFRAQLDLAPAGQTGAMVALVPSLADAARLAIDGGEPVDQLHLTLWFLGEAADHPSTLRADLAAAIQSMVDRRAVPAVVAKVFGASLWNPDSDTPAWVYAVGDPPEGERPDGQESLAVYRAMVAEAWHDGMVAVDLPPQHTPWQPHVCAAYSADPALLEVLTSRTGPVVFDRLRVAFAGQVSDIPLGSASGPAVRLSVAEIVRDELAQLHQLKFDPNQDRDRRGRWTDGGGGVGIDGSTVITKEMLTPSGGGNTMSAAEQDELNDRNAHEIAQRWTASQDDKDALMRADGPWFESEGRHLPPEERNEAFIRDELVKSRSGVGPVTIAGAAAVADRLGIVYDLGEVRGGQVDYIRARPELDRATRALGEAMYANTQDWLRERGIESVDLFRLRGLYDDKAVMTSWTIREGAAFNAPQHEGGRELLHEAIPADRVFSLAATGLGALEEEEFLVFNAHRTGDSNGAAAGRAESTARPQVLAIVRDELARLHPGHPSQKVHGRKRGVKAAVEALIGQAALDATPATLTRPSRNDSNRGDYSTARLDGPDGMGSAETLAAYEGVEYFGINNHLRHGPIPVQPGDRPDDRTRIDERNAQTAAWVADIDQTMDVSRLTADVEVHRVIKNGASVFGRDAWYGDVIDWSSDDFDKVDQQVEVWESGVRPDLTGLRWREDAYSSTTADPSVAPEFGRRWPESNSPVDGEPVIMTIRVPAGTGAVQLSEMSTAERDRGAAEILLQRGLTMQVVADHGVDEAGFRRIDVEVVAG